MEPLAGLRAFDVVEIESSDNPDVAIEATVTRQMLVPVVVASQRPIIMESGRLSSAHPPETRNDLTQYPGALTLNFGPITHDGVTFVPVGIWARYVTNSIDISWLGAQPPILSVLYRAGGS